MSQAQVRTGECQDARRGQTHHKCELQCNFDGSCTESVSEEQCGCDGIAFFAGVQNYFEASILHPPQFFIYILHIRMYVAQI